MNVSAFYERYWHKKGGSPADHGYALTERKQKLKEALASLPPGSPVLDVGCGNGEFAACLSWLGYQVSGVDISAAAVEHARIACPTGSFEVASLELGLSAANGNAWPASCS